MYLALVFTPDGDLFSLISGSRNCGITKHNFSLRLIVFIVDNNKRMVPFVYVFSVISDGR